MLALTVEESPFRSPSRAIHMLILVAEKYGFKMNIIIITFMDTCFVGNVIHDSTLGTLYRLKDMGNILSNPLLFTSFGAKSNYARFDNL